MGGGVCCEFYGWCCFVCFVEFYMGVVSLFVCMYMCIVIF